MGVIAHGDETRGGSGSKVNMEAMLRSRGYVSSWFYSSREGAIGVRLVKLRIAALRW